MKIGVIAVNISVREKMIIEALIEEQDEMTIKELSKLINVSARTIHRDLNNLQGCLHLYQLTLMRKSGVGVQIVGSTESKHELKKQLHLFTFREYSQDERLSLLLCILYELSEPIKLYTLAKELRVSIATVSMDLIKLEEQIKPMQLTILKKRGYGVELFGSEKAKRKAMSYVIEKALKDEGLFSLIKEQIHQQASIEDGAVFARLIQLVDRKKISIIEEMMKNIDIKQQFSMADSSYVGFMVHLGLAMERILAGKHIEIDSEYMNQLKLEPEYPFAVKIVNQLQERFQVHIPDAEAGYITMHLQGAKLRQQTGILQEASNLELYMQVKKLVQLMEDTSGYRFMNNTSLIEGLVMHLKPALYRIKQNMGITNPLLKEIRLSYTELFELVKEVTEKVFVGLNIPDEEIGYLVMHFGSAMLNMKDKGNLRAYIVCSSGIGTSKLLATRLQQEIQEIAEIINVSIFELNHLPITERDLVISTIYLRDFHKEYMIVSPLLSKDEIKQVQQYARRQMLLTSSQPNIEEKPETIEVMTKRMKKIHLYTGAISKILSNFCLTKQLEYETSTDCIRQVCHLLEKEQIVLGADHVSEALVAREALSGIGIPGTKLALYHTTNEKVLKPSFTMHKLGQPFVMKGMDGREMEVETILLLLSTKPYHPEGLEVLSLISTIIIENEKSIHLFETAEEQAIHSYLAQKFEQFIVEKIK